MKKLIIGAAVLIIMAGIGLYLEYYKIFNDQTQNSNGSSAEYDETTIPKAVDNFYQKYEYCLKNPPAQASGRVSEYCQINLGLTTEAFAGNLEKGGIAAAGADPIFCAQSMPESMKAGVDFHIKNNKATGFMEEKFGSNQIKVRVEFVEEQDVWKVDNVICPVPVSILPADSEYPAAGVCAEPGEEDVVRVEVNQDIPSPRCQKVLAGNHLIIKNNTDEALLMWFGKNKEYSISVSAKGEYQISEPLGMLLAPGVHDLYGTPYQGPEIWFIVEETPYLYRFKDFAVNEIYNGAPAPVDFSAYPAAKNFKTKITEAVKLGSNFAGHYTVAEWGCGTSCQMHAIIDAKTGVIAEYGLGSVLGLEYELDSRLLVVNPPSQLNNFGEVLKDTGIIVEYYEIKDNDFSLLARQTPGESVAMICAQVITRAKNIYTNEEKDFPSPCSVPSDWLPISPQNGNSILPYDSGVSGTVFIGPICPVMKDPPDPACANKPYKSIVQVIAINSFRSSPFATVESNDQGYYKIMLPPGEYAVQALGGDPLPRCETKNVTVETKLIKEVNLFCDTGIR